VSRHPPRPDRTISADSIVHAWSTGSVLHRRASRSGRSRPGCCRSRKASCRALDLSHDESRVHSVDALSCGAGNAGMYPPELFEIQFPRYEPVHERGSKSRPVPPGDRQ
jgi:hypothetical protein